MNYWHMQLHPGDRWNWHHEKDVLNLDPPLIGLGNEDPYAKQFKTEMEKGDVVAIWHGDNELIALVEVTGECEATDTNDNDIYCFWQKKYAAEEINYS